MGAYSVATIENLQKRAEIFIEEKLLINAMTKKMLGLHALNASTYLRHHRCHNLLKFWEKSDKTRRNVLS